MFFVLETHCRPVDAAYLVANNPFKTSRATPGCDYFALMPERYGKTDAWYEWPLDRKLNWAVELIGEIHSGPYCLKRYLEYKYVSKNITWWFNDRVLRVCA